jgi:hypothetical protein
VKKFRKWQSRHGQAALKTTTLRYEPDERSTPITTDVAQALQRVVELAERGHLEITVDEHGKARGAYVAEVPDEILWNSLRDLLINQPELVVKMTGIPELANFRNMDLPRPSLKLSELIDAYEKHSPACMAQSKRDAVTISSICDAKSTA